MSKRPNLADIAAAAGSTRRQPPAPAVVQPVQTQAGEGREVAGSKPPSRSGTKQVAGHFPTEVAWQLRELAVERRATVQELLGEALNDLFQKYGKPELAPVRQKGLS